MNSNSVKFILTVHYRCLIIVNKMHNRITFLYNVILIYGIKLLTFTNCDNLTGIYSKTDSLVILCKISILKIIYFLKSNNAGTHVHTFMDCIWFKLYFLNTAFAYFHASKPRRNTLYLQSIGGFFFINQLLNFRIGNTIFNLYLISIFKILFG